MGCGELFRPGCDGCPYLGAYGNTERQFRLLHQADGLQRRGQGGGIFGDLLPQGLVFRQCDNQDLKDAEFQNLGQSVQRQSRRFGGFAFFLLFYCNFL